jgi:UDP-N-acetylglucosamine--N-acetylmuramyl-(pentapeptide) pyrophosphoryl-undecaprenol N-acetylglucosamine transferase
MLIITAGGTGGHLFPAIALAEAYKKQFPAGKVILVGTLTPIDKEIYQASGFPFQLLSFNRPSGGLKGKIKLAYQIIRSVYQAIKLIRKNKPQLIAACGGFGCVPLAFAAKLTRTPFVLLEQNVIPGRTNLFLAESSSCVFAEYSESIPYFKPKVKLEHLGNPIRQNILNIKPSTNQNSIVFMGGSQGSKKINDIAFEIIPGLLASYPNLKIYHLTGKTDFEKYKQNEKYSQVKVLDFTNNMEEIYSNAKLIIARSGATSIAEIATLGIPTIFIPYPHAKDDHQKANAKALVSIGAGIMIEETALSATILNDQIIHLLKDESQWNAIANSIKQWSKPKAGEAIIQSLQSSGLLE